MKLTRENRIIACLLGGALGDAIGSCFEGSTRGELFRIPPQLIVTDDTQFTIATAEAIIENRVVSAESIAKHFVRWHRERRFSGMGSSTLKALTELDAGGHWALVGATGERSAGNGAAMRIAPVSFFLNPDLYDERRTIRDICRITHRNDEAYVGALAILRSIRYVTDRGELDHDLLKHLIDSLPDSNVRDRLTIVRDTSLTVESYASRFGTTGYVADSVPLAIIAAIEARSAMDMIERLVQLGGDTDTTASMFGQIIGAAHGVESLPMHTIAAIDAALTVQETAAELSRVSMGT